MAIIFLFGSSHKYRAIAKPFWFPPLWVMHVGSLVCSGLMGVSAWAVWSEGGFRGESDALPLYVAHISLGIVWEPLVVVMGAAWMGLGFCVVHFGTLVACYSAFRNVNPVVGELVKPCLAWEDNKNKCSCTILQTGGGQAESDRQTVLKWLVSYQYEWKRWINVSVSEDILTCL
ncbi:translocator protein homolog [Vitis riparia]|uniref:translocator protein homolog n=1 Tax=Vitis riparia TaxID=96939 RepID=UPI00155A70E5|nr:translocator protein homolog [Vitis riparia]